MLEHQVHLLFITEIVENAKITNNNYFRRQAQEKLSGKEISGIITFYQILTDFS